MDYKIAFVGACFPDIILNDLIDRGEIKDVPANVFGWKIVDGLISNGKAVRVINEHKVEKFPKGPLFVSREEDDEYGIVNYAYINLKYFDKIEKQFKIYRELTKYHPEIILVYSLHSPYLRPSLKYAHKHGSKVISIVPDLPQYMFAQQNIVEKQLKKWDINSILSMIKRIDGFILLTEQMKDELRISSPYMIMEGIADRQNDSEEESQHIRGDYVLYSGALSEKYGVSDLIEAFLSIDAKTELWLCGHGLYEKELLQISESNNRIKYLGMLNRDQLKEIQKRALLLVNPRNSEDVYTKYSFPSKTIEYLQSGTPVMMEKLEGIPDEYFDYIIEVKNHNWEKSLRQYLNMPIENINKIGLKGKLFILEHKAVIKQGKKIVDFIDSIRKM